MVTRQTAARLDIEPTSGSTRAERVQTLRRRGVVARVLPPRDHQPTHTGICSRTGLAVIEHPRECRKWFPKTGPAKEVLCVLVRAAAPKEPEWGAFRAHGPQMHLERLVVRNPRHLPVRRRRQRPGSLRSPAPGELFASDRPSSPDVRRRGETRTWEAAGRGGRDASRGSTGGAARLHAPSPPLWSGRAARTSTGS